MDHPVSSILKHFSQTGTTQRYRVPAHRLVSRPLPCHCHSCGANDFNSNSSGCCVIEKGASIGYCRPLKSPYPKSVLQNTHRLVTIQSVNLNKWQCKREQAAVTLVASQCLLHCGNQRMCTQVEPTLLLLATVEQQNATKRLLKYATSMTS